jgi:riboflavin biosynthesis pyrimidine reductase
VRIHVIGRGSGEIPAADILRAVRRAITGKRILVEGGPRLLATFYKERLIDEQFLSLAPQLSGRQIGDARMGLVMGKTFAPRDPLWGRLTDVRQGSRLLFLRYSF